MKIFVTGGTGFIGSHFISQALGVGHHILALRRKNAKTRIPFLQQPEWVNGQIDDDWTKELSQCGALVHLAAAGVTLQKADWEELFDVNVRQSLNLWQQAVRAGVKRLLVCGSCFEYGKKGEHYEFIPPDAPLEPTHAYAASKAAATMAAIALATESRIELLVLRPFHTFGEGEEMGRFWPSLREAAQTGMDFPMTTGNQVRDFVPVEKVASAFVAALDRNDLLAGVPKIENIGTGKPQSLRAFAEFWWKSFNARGQLKFGAVPNRPNEVMRYVPKLTCL